MGTLDRFYSKVVYDNRSGCMLWNASISGSGYGSFNYRGRQISAHRLAWIFERGEIPDGLFVCHTCDVKRCVNTDHMFLGTALDNMQDKVNKGRLVPSKGEANGSSKLSADDVFAIRESGKANTELAKIYGVSDACISLIVNRKTWTHI